MILFDKTKMFLGKKFVPENIRIQGTVIHQLLGKSMILFNNKSMVLFGKSIVLLYRSLVFLCKSMVFVNKSMILFSKSKVLFKKSICVA